MPRKWIAITSIVLTLAISCPAVYHFSFKSGRISMAGEILMLVGSHESVVIGGIEIIPSMIMYETLHKAGVKYRKLDGVETDLKADSVSCYDCHELGTLAGEMEVASYTRIKRK